MLTSDDLKSIERVVEKVVDSKISPFYNEFQEHRKEFYELTDQFQIFKNEFQKFKKVSIEWFENIFDDLQGKHQEMRELKSKVSRLEKIQSIIT